jgi:hypothetical protein
MNKFMLYRITRVTSIYINSELFDSYKVRITIAKFNLNDSSEKLKSQLYIRQKGLCKFCNKIMDTNSEIIFGNEYDPLVIHEVKINIGGGWGIVNLWLFHLSCSTVVKKFRDF